MNKRGEENIVVILVVAALVIGIATYLTSTWHFSGITGAAILSAGGDLSCTLAEGACPGGYTSVLRLSNRTNAHAELANGTDLPFNVCCTDTSGRSTIHTTSNGTAFLNLSNLTNAHVSNDSTYPNDPNYNYANYSAFIAASNSRIVCTYTDTTGVCPANFACLATVSNFTNAHVANCSAAEAYTTTICCELLTINTTYIRPLESIAVNLSANGTIDGGLSNGTVTYETQNITFINISTDRRFLRFTALFNQTDVNLENLTVETDDRRIAVNTSNVTGISDGHTLFLPNRNAGRGIIICPNATGLVDVSEGCTNSVRMDGPFPQTSGEFSASIDDNDYKIDGLASSGAMLISKFNVSSCGTPITASNAEYTVNNSLTATAATCLTVQASNITLNCTSGVIIESEGDSTGTSGVNASNVVNLTIQNCFIRDFDVAINFTGTNNSLILNNTLVNNSAGVLLENSSFYNQIINNTINSSIGIYVRFDSNNNTVVTNLLLSRIGIILERVTDNNISMNNISTTGAESQNYGIELVDSSNFNKIDANTISTNGTSSNFGILLNTSSNFNRIGSNSISTNGTSSSNIGIHVVTSSNNSISNNNISTGGTSSNDGINIVSTSNNTITGNNISTSGSSSSNRGIGLRLSVGSTIRSNTISTNGTSSNLGINLILSNGSVVELNSILTHGTDFDNIGISLAASFNNTASANNISTAGTSVNVGINLFLASNNNISNNNISTSGSDVASANTGIRIDGISNFNTISSNTISTSGTDSNLGIEFSSSSNNTASNNNIFTHGEGGNDGIGLTSSSNNTVTDNNISTSGSSLANRGLALTTSSNFNILARNIISTNGTSDNYGILLQSSFNNTFSANNLSTRGTSSYGVLITSSNDSVFNNTLLSNTTQWLNSDGGALNNFTNTTFIMDDGNIKISGTFLLNGSHDVTRTKLNITSNLAFLNSSNLTFLNTSAQVTLLNNLLTDPAPFVDFDDDGVFQPCFPPQCTEVSFAAGAFVFDVASFTYYTSQASAPNISVNKTDIPDPVFGGALLNYTINVTNFGTAQAGNVTVEEIFSPNVSFISASPAPNITNGMAVWQLANLSVTESRQINITVRVNTTIVNNTNLTNFANVSWFNGSEDIFHVNTTINTTAFADTEIPAVFDLIPEAARNFNITTLMEIAANATDNVNVTVVFANITLPNGTIQQLELPRDGITPKFNASLVIPNVQGKYIVLFIANDTSNNTNMTETTFFFASANSFINNSNILNSSIINSTVLNSNITNSTIDNSTIDNSFIANSTVINSTIINSTVINSIKINAIVINASNFGSTVLNSTEKNTTLDNSSAIDSEVNNTLINQSAVNTSTVLGSTILNSTITDSTIINSTVINSTKTNVTAVNATITNSTDMSNALNNSIERDSNLTTTNANFCTILESTLSDSECANSFIERGSGGRFVIDPSNVTNTTCNGGTCVVTNSNVSESTLGNSTVLNSNVSTSIIENSTVNISTVSASNLTNATATNSTVTNSALNASTAFQSSIINSTVLNNSIVNNSITIGTLIISTNLSNSTLINNSLVSKSVNLNSEINHSTQEASSLTNVFAAACIFANTVLGPSTCTSSDMTRSTGAGWDVDPSNVTNSTCTLEPCTITNSNVTFSTVSNVTLVSSNINGSIVRNTTANISNVTGATVTNATLINATVNASQVDMSSITNSTVTQESIINVSSSVINSLIITSNLTNSTLINNSAATLSNIFHSEINHSSPQSSSLTNVFARTCIFATTTITNSACKDSDMTAANGTGWDVDPSNVTGSVCTLALCDITDSNVTFSTVANSTITNSNVSNSTISNTTATASQVINSTKLNSNLTNATVFSATNTNCTLVNSLESNVTCTNSFINSSFIANSTLIINMTINNANIVGDQCVSGTIIFNGVVNACPIALADIITPPAAPAPAAEEAAAGGGGGGGGGSLICQPRWQCTDWNACTPDGTQTRTCSDANRCAERLGEAAVAKSPPKPAETQSCAYVTPTPSCVDNILNQDETDVDCGGSCPPCAVEKSCLISADCSSANCLNSVCRDAGIECLDDSDCTGGNECRQGKCVLEEVGRIPIVVPEFFKDMLAGLKDVAVAVDSFIISSALSLLGGLKDTAFTLGSSLASGALSLFSALKNSAAAIGSFVAANLQTVLIILVSVVGVLGSYYSYNAYMASAYHQQRLQRKKAHELEEKKTHVTEHAYLLNEFIKNAVVEGFTQKQIQDALVAKGWPAKIITKYVEYFFQSNKKFLKDLQQQRKVSYEEHLNYLQEELKGLKK